jgi:MYXO-CTERM domain-containing protein
MFVLSDLVGSNTGSGTDNLTTDPTPTVSGTGTPGDVVKITDPQGNVVGSTTVAPDGSWNVTPTAPLPEGVNNLAITVTNPSGQVSPAAPFTVVIDTTAPSLSATAPTVAMSTSAGSAGNSPGETITLTLTLDGPVQGLSSGTASGLFLVNGEAVDARWSGTDGSADGADGSGEGGGEGSTYTGDTAPLDPIVDEAGLTEWKGGGEDGGCSTVPGSSAGVGLALLGLLVGGRRRRSA